MENMIKNCSRSSSLGYQGLAAGFFSTTTLFPVLLLLKQMQGELFPSVIISLTFSTSIVEVVVSIILFMEECGH